MNHPRLLTTIFASPVAIGNVLAVGAFVVILVLFSLAGRAFGREPEPPWMCDDTRYTQLVPRGRAVVGPPVSPPPGCAP